MDKFSITGAKEILNFTIPHMNKNFEINNNLIKKEITEKILKKLEKIYDNYIKLIKDKNDDKKLDDFLKKKPLTDFDELLIPFMIIQSEKLYKQTPRAIQIICLLFYLEGYANKYGLILEVLTGEGKTLTISFLALYLAIKGNKVDILTSSPVLAERDSKDRKKFYKRFGIKCDFCRNDFKTFNEDDTLECYNADIVYGDGISLIGDILRYEFMGKKGRGKRPFDIIIIDEIDNICLDNLRNIIELIDNFPGFKYLEYLYLFIYNSLKMKIDEFEREHKEKFEEKIAKDKKKKNIIINEDEKERKRKIDFSKKLKEEVESIMYKVSKKTRKFLKENRVKNIDSVDKILIPPNCLDFIDERIEHWSKMAYDAMYNFEIDKHYIIIKDEILGFDTIKPIDYVNTGVTLKDSVWSGLHQFLQIKEGLRLTEENINSSFMSYLSFFRKYKMINGITGTLGSKKTQQTINKLYNINLLKMPPFKTRQLLIFEPKVYHSEEEYKTKLVNEIINYSVGLKRVVLVLFEYIDEVKNMKEFLKKKRNELKLEKTKIISYERSDIPFKNLEKEMEPNTIILSTNLSGRGTDIKLNSEVKKNGGLHVIITFMPYNERTEKQAQGRAGRCGDKGSSITFIHSKNDYKTLESRRNAYELDQYKFLINLYSSQLDLNQKFFEEFCKRLKGIKNKNKISENIISDLKERWSMFILKNNIDSFMNDDIHPNLSDLVYKLYERITTKNFNNLMKEINLDNLDNYKFNNLFYQMKSNLTDDDYKNAIENSQEFSIGAYYNQAYYYIKNKNENYKNVVKHNFEILEKICKKFNKQFYEYIGIFYEIHENDNKDEKKYENYFVEQCIQKIELFTTIRDNINKNLKIIKSSDEKSEFVAVKDIFHFKVYPRDIKEYFSGFGIDFLYKITIMKSQTDFIDFEFDEKCE